jgi:hypothetical protein
MRDPVNVFYYPEMIASDSTLKKAILFFDEIHFMDRASFFFGGGRGQIGTIGAASPLREYEDAFRESGVPLYVHPASIGSLKSETLDRVGADINDPSFLTCFQEGLQRSRAFRDLQITPGNYGRSGTHEDLATQLISVDLASALRQHPNAMALLMDGSIEPFQTRTPAECGRVLIQDAAICSVKMNFALQVSGAQGFVPFADAAPFGALLATKYRRAVDVLRQGQTTVQVTDLSFAVFDELVPSEALEEMTFGDVIRYRKESASAREAFLEHLSVLQAKQGALNQDEDYEAAIRKIVMEDIVPAARTFKDKLEGTRDSLFGNLAKGVLGALGTGSIGSVGLTLFGALSWPHLLALAGPAVAFAGNAAIDAFLSRRAATRECAISYVLSLDS